MNGSHEQQWKARFEQDTRLRSALESSLIPSEAVDVIAYGAGGCAVMGTSAGVLVYKRGIKAGIPFGHRLKAFEFESVVAVNVREIAEGVVLAVHAPLKVGSCLVYWLDERDNAWKARNAVLAEPEEATGFEAIAVELRELLAAHRTHHGRATPPAEPRIRPVPTPAEPAAAVHRSCEACGADVVATWRFCPECGTSFGGSDRRLRWPRAIHGAGR
jgi:hypothetical protein